MSGMSRYLGSLGLLCACFIVGCQTAPVRPLVPKVPDGSQLAVIKFRDCLISTESYCNSSGDNVATLVASVLDDPPHMQAILVERPVGAKDELNVAAAVAYGKSKGYAYVVNGEVPVLHRAPPASIEEQRAGIEMRVLRTSDGLLVDTYGCQGNFNGLSSLDMMIETMAEDLRDSLEDNENSYFTYFVTKHLSCDEP